MESMPWIRWEIELVPHRANPLDIDAKYEEVNASDLVMKFIVTR